MDYRELLKKYMLHVGEQEGITFLDSMHNQPSGFVEFSKEEQNELRKIENEIWP